MKEIEMENSDLKVMQDGVNYEGQGDAWGDE